MIKANQTEPTPAGSMDINLEGMRRLRDTLQFPIDLKARKARMERTRLSNQITHLQRRAADYEKGIVITTTEIAAEQKRLAAIAMPGNEPVPTLERAKAQLDALAKLPWVESVKVDGPQLRVVTRKGMLKTLLDKRLVLFPNANFRTEYLAEPVMVSMPQYEINFQPSNAGNGGWAGNTSNLAVRLIDEIDGNAYAGNKLHPQHTLYPHWASNGNPGIGSWNSLCLGEYADDLNNASIQGLVPFFEALATYLQTSGDEHAYRPKSIWAMHMGRADYNDHTLRIADKDETPQQVDERYKRDFRLMNQVEIPEGATINPGLVGGGTISVRTLRQNMEDALRVDRFGSLLDEAAADISGTFYDLATPLNPFSFDDDDDVCTGDDCGVEDCGCECHEEDSLAMHE